MAKSKRTHSSRKTKARKKAVYRAKPRLEIEAIPSEVNPNTQELVQADLTNTQEITTTPPVELAEAQSVRSGEPIEHVIPQTEPETTLQLSTKEPRKYFSTAVFRGIVLATSLTALIAFGLHRWHHNFFVLQPGTAQTTSAVSTLYEDYKQASLTEHSIADEQVAHGIIIAGLYNASDELDHINWLFATAQPVEAIWRLTALQSKLGADNAFVDQKIAELAEAKAKQAKHAGAAQAAAPVHDTTFIPIVMYHKTPTDFESQLQIIQKRGYTTITMAQVACGLRKTCTLPPKPLVITFDDGYSDQLRALSILQKYQMRATYYLIIGGEKSKYCIGIERTPGLACGDSYMNWDEVRGLVASELIEIGAHTIDHLALAGLSAGDQVYQITTSKQRLEQELGLSITTLAYPYGSYNTVSITAAQQAGFSTAVSTVPGSDQSLGNIFALHRIRNTYALP